MQETRSVTSRSGVPVGHPSDTPETVRKPKLPDRLREALRSRHYSRRTEQTYCHQFRWFFSLHNIRPRFTIPLPHVCLRMAMISGRFRSFSAFKDVKTTMIYTHVLNRGGKGVRSPADSL